LSMKTPTVFLSALGMIVFIFGILLWAYSILIQVTHPEWLPSTLTHHDFPPLNWRVDDMGIFGFAIAPFGLFAWILSSLLSKPSRRREQTSGS